VLFYLLLATGRQSAGAFSKKSRFDDWVLIVHAVDSRASQTLQSPKRNLFALAVPGERRHETPHRSRLFPKTGNAISDCERNHGPVMVFAV
jgi:hypothetical protein